MDENQIEIRSPEVNEVLSYIPNWMIRWGITVIFASTLIFILLCWFIKYPEVISSEIIFYTKNPPSPLIAQVDRKIDKILVADSQQVCKEKYLIILENSSNLEHIKCLKLLLDSIYPKIYESYKISIHLEFPQGLVIGEIQNDYLQFQFAYIDYQKHIERNYYESKNLIIEDKIQLINSNIKRLDIEHLTIKNQLKLQKKRYNIDSLDFTLGGISEATLFKSRSELLNVEKNYYSAKNAISNHKIELLKLKELSLDFKEKNFTEKKQLIGNIKRTFNVLYSKFLDWEKQYVLKSPINGYVSFTEYWSANQYIRKGTRVITIVPLSNTELTNKLKLPIKGAGKVKIGQSVNIKLHNYPFYEYGIIKGKIETISAVTEDGYYIVKIMLSNRLMTTYGKVVNFQQEMQGVADIITEDISLLERIVYPVKQLILDN